MPPVHQLFTQWEDGGIGQSLKIDRLKSSSRPLTPPVPPWALVPKRRTIPSPSCSLRRGHSTTLTFLDVMRIIYPDAPPPRRLLLLLMLLLLLLVTLLLPLAVPSPP